MKELDLQHAMLLCWPVAAAQHMHILSNEHCASLPFCLTWVSAPCSGSALHESHLAFDQRYLSIRSHAWKHIALQDIITPMASTNSLLTSTLRPQLTESTQSLLSYPLHSPQYHITVLNISIAGYSGHNYACHKSRSSHSPQHQHCRTEWAQSLLL